MSAGEVRVAVASPHELTRRGLMAMLRASQGLRLVEAPVELLASGPAEVDVVLLDLLALDEGEGRRLLGAVLARRRVVGLEPPGRRDLAERALAQGVAGLVPMSVVGQELTQAVLDAASGQRMTAAEHRRAAQAGLRTRFGLTDRELTILALVGAGLTNKGIAGRLYLSINSVKTYIRSAYGRIGVTSRSEAVLWAVAHQVAEPESRVAAES